MARINRNPEGYRTRKGKYWLKDTLNNCTVKEICPDCPDWYVCLDEFLDGLFEGKYNLGMIKSAEI